jgi:glycosyltransferase involved in cell wall biosynthesis
MSSRKVDVLFLIPSLQGGGAERVVSVLLRHIERSRFRLTLAVLDGSDSVFRDDIPDDVEVIVLDRVRVRYAVLAIIRLIRTRRPEVVFSTLGHLNLALAMLRPLLPSACRYIARETSIVSLLESAFDVHFWWGWAYRRFLGRLDVIVCQSEAMRRDLVDNLGLSANKTCVINNPVDAQRIRQLALQPAAIDFSRDRSAVNGTIELVAAGSLGRVKGFDLLVEAIALCANPRLHLTIVGDGPLRAELQLRAATLGVSAQIRFVGFQRNPYPYFAAADAFILSSRFEGFPNVVLEAMALGTPVISTPAPGGVRESLDRVPGCALADSVSADGLANAIRRFEFGHRLVADVVLPYAVDAITRRYEAVFAPDVA